MRQWLFALLVLAPTSIANAWDWTVCQSGCDFADLEQAMAGVSGGDTLRLRREEYSIADLDVYMPITIVGEEGTVLRVASYANTGLRVAAPALTLSTLTITPELFQASYSVAIDMTICCYSPAVTLDRVVIRGFRGLQGAVRMSGGSLTIQSSILEHNLSTSLEAGAHIFLDGGSVTLIDSTLQYGTAASDGRGGALMIRDGYVVALRTTFAGNTAGTGGAMYLRGGTFEAEDCVFSGNSAGARGGVLAVENASSVAVRVTHSQFRDNQAGEGGVFSDVDGMALRVVDSTFVANRASFGGGGVISVQGGGGRTLELSRNRFCGNESTTGGGVLSALNGATAAIDNRWHNNVFVANRSVNTSNSYGGVFHLTDTALQSRYNTYLANVASVGGAVYRGCCSDFTSKGDVFAYTSAGSAVTSQDGGVATLVDSVGFANRPEDFAGNVSSSSELLDQDPLFARLALDATCGDDVRTFRPESVLWDTTTTGDLDVDGTVADRGSYGGPDADPLAWIDADGDTYPWAHDCDDADVDVFPGASESCNGLDDDCDGAVDDGCTSPDVDAGLDADAGDTAAGPDAGAEQDAGATGSDAGAEQDAGATMRDAGATAPDGGVDAPAAPTEGCACRASSEGAGSGPGAAAAGVLLAAIVLRRRRRPQRARAA